MSVSRASLEEQLNDFDPVVRKEVLELLLKQVDAGEITLPEPEDVVNLHCHTFFSYNGFGYSPTYIAWRARCEGLLAVGIVDFDVLDAVDEFLAVCGKLGIRACAGLETRIYIPEFGDRVINSPGEPGIAYHMGVGFTSSNAGDQVFLDGMKDRARARNLGILSRVNPYLAPVELDYEKDVLPLTPAGNATERHICMAYEAKAEQVFPDTDERAKFWGEKLNTDTSKIAEMLGDSPTLQGLIRSKTMKSGGVGYVKPEGSAFPRLDEVNSFVKECGAIPTFAWLDGSTEGEQAIGELLDLEMANGTAALNIIPDRNWNISDPAVKKEKVANLYKIVEIAKERALPLVVGTEMNAYGQRFVDDFSAPELKPLVPAFIEGAQIIYAHTRLQAAAGMGYLSEWARVQFASVADKNAFFAALGAKLEPGAPIAPDALSSEMTPEQVSKALGG